MDSGPLSKYDFWPLDTLKIYAEMILNIFEPWTFLSEQPEEDRNN